MLRPRPKDLPECDYSDFPDSKSIEAWIQSQSCLPDVKVASLPLATEHHDAFLYDTIAPTPGISHFEKLEIRNPSNVSLYWCSVSGRLVDPVPCYYGMGINDKRVSQLNSVPLVDATITITSCKYSGNVPNGDRTLITDLRTHSVSGKLLVEYGCVYVREFDKVLCTPEFLSLLRMGMPVEFNDEKSCGPVLRLRELRRSIIDDRILSAISGLVYSNNSGYLSNSFACGELMYNVEVIPTRKLFMIVNDAVDAPVPLGYSPCSAMTMANIGATVRYRITEPDPNTGELMNTVKTEYIDDWLYDDTKTSFKSFENGKVKIFKSYDDLVRYTKSVKNETQKDAKIAALEREIVQLKDSTIPKDAAQDYAQDVIAGLEKTIQDLQVCNDAYKVEIEELKKTNKKLLSTIKSFGDGKTQAVLDNVSKTGLELREAENELKRLRLENERLEAETKRAVAPIEKSIGFGRLFADIGKVFVGVVSTVLLVLKLF